MMHASRLIHQAMPWILISVALFAPIRADEPNSFRVKMPDVASVAISPDGKTLATGGSAASRVMEGLDEGIIKLWDMSTGRETATFWQSGRREKDGDLVSDTLNSVGRLAFSPDGKLLVGGDRLGYKVWDISTGKELLALEDGNRYTGAAFSPDGKTLAVRARGVTRLIEVATGKETARLAQPKGGAIGSVAFAPDGKILAAASGSNLTVWDLGTNTVLFEDEIQWVLDCCCFSPDGQFLVSTGNGAVLKLYKITTADRQVRVVRQKDSSRYQDAADTLVFLPDGKRLFAACADHVYVWDVASWKTSAVLKGNCVAVSSDNKVIALGNARRGIVEVGEAAKFFR